MSVKYLAKNKQSGILEEIKFNEWQEIINNNLKLPLTQRRFFMKDVIKEVNHLDEIYIEVSHKEYKKWNSENTVYLKKSKYKENYTFQSLNIDWEKNKENENYKDFNSINLVEELTLDNVLMEEIIKKIREWKPWGEDLFLEYMKGNKRNCTRDLAVKFNVSDNTIRRYKKEFENFIKKIIN